MTSSALDGLRALLGSTVFDPSAWERLAAAARPGLVAPDAIVQPRGAPVAEVVGVEAGLLVVGGDGEDGATRWAPRGAVLGLAAALAGDAAASPLVAVRHTALWRLPIDALLAALDAGGAGLGGVARLARLGDIGLATRRPAPVVALALLSGCSPEVARALLAALDAATRQVEGVGLVAPAAFDPAAPDLPARLAAAEAAASPRLALHVVVAGDDPARAEALASHADRVYLFHPAGGYPDEPAAHLALTRRHGATDVVLLRGAPVAAAQETVRGVVPIGADRLHLLGAEGEIDPAPLRRLLEEALAVGDGAETALRAFPLFNALGDDELAWVAQRLTWTQVDGGAVLMREGEPADDLWLVRAGRFAVTAQRGESAERTIGSLGPGDVAGEVALLAGRARTATVRATRDSTVARLERATFDGLLARSPTFASALAHTLAERAAGGRRGEALWARTIALVPLVEGGRAQELGRALAEALAAEGLDARAVDAATLDGALGAGAAQIRRGYLGDVDLVAWLDRLERDHDALVFVCDDAFTPWTRRCLRHADLAVTVADAGTSPELRPVERALAASEEPFFGRRQLVLLQPAGIAEATGTAAWLAERDVTAHHHLRAGDAGDLARLARRVSGRAVAVAFSGASSRAPAHLGVVRGARTVGLPIDAVSGSSSGAGVAGLVAAGLPADEALARGVRIIEDGAPGLLQMQPPFTALTSGAAPDRALQAAFGERLLEDQLIPAALTAVDIRRHALVALTRGPIWEAVRASGSLPLVWPPVWRDDALLVDGGIMSYLPVEPLADEADEGLLIASNLDATAGKGALAFEDALRYGTRVSGWRQLWRRIVRSKRPRPPGLVDVLFHTMAIPSFREQEGLADLAARANVCMVTPPLEAFGLFEVGADVGRRLEEAAFDYTREALAAPAQRWHASRR